MPFLGQDWRSPGQSWVKTEDGWKKTTKDENEMNNNVSERKRSVFNDSTFTFEVFHLVFSVHFPHHKTNGVVYCRRNLRQGAFIKIFFNYIYLAYIMTLILFIGCSIY